MVKIYDSKNVFLSSDVSVVRQKADVVLRSMRDELDDHRLAINENTGEVAQAYDLLNQLNQRMDKMAERLDELTLLIKGTSAKREFKIQTLTVREKETFRALYVLTQTRAWVCYADIARQALSSKSQVTSHVAAMLQKGVPLRKRSDGGRTFICLDSMFRECQTKTNLIGLDAPLTCWLR